MDRHETVTPPVYPGQTERHPFSGRPNETTPLNPKAVPLSTSTSPRSDLHKSQSSSAIYPSLHNFRRLSSSHEFEESKRRPFIHRLIENQYSVTNPHGDSGGLNIPSNGSNLNLESSSSVHSIPDLEEQNRRLHVLNGLRPQRLIGDYHQLCNWMESYVSPEQIKKIKNKGLRKYYSDQNYLIERFQEIDLFLDASKVHYNMLSNYGSDNDPSRIHTEECIMEVENENEDGFMTPEGQKKSSLVGKSSRFNDLPANINEGAHFLNYDAQLDDHSVLVAIIVNFFINTLLLVGKIIITVLTSSMSIIASLVDSILDFLSTFIIYIANKLSTTKNWQTQHAYPIGRSRLEPLGILIFSVIIIISFFQVGQEAFKKLLSSQGSPVQIGVESIIIMLLTILCKLGCFYWCSHSKSSSVRALAQDAKTDVIFNLVSLIMPTIGYYAHIWWLDPLGALLLSIYIVVEWGKTAFEHIDNLTGALANELDYKVILYLSYRFAESIKQITALKVYHMGDNLNVEIDLVFNYEEFNLTFKDCHDIAEALQYSIETLPMIERAFVHIDYMEGNFKGHLQ